MSYETQVFKLSVSSVRAACAPAYGTVFPNVNVQDRILEQSTIEYKNDMMSMDTVHIENRERQQVWKDDSLIRVLAALVGDPGLVSNANVMTYQHS